MKETEGDKEANLRQGAEGGWKRKYRIKKEKKKKGKIFKGIKNNPWGLAKPMVDPVYFFLLLASPVLRYWLWLLTIDVGILAHYKRN